MSQLERAQYQSAIEAVAQHLLSAAKTFGMPGDRLEALPARLQEELLTHSKELLEVALTHLHADLFKLIADLADPDPCWFDHRGGCQAHGYLELQHDEPCPQALAQQLTGGLDS